MDTNTYKGVFKESLIFDFCLKQDFKFDCWVCPELKNQVVCSGYIFDIKDIYEDIINKCEKGVILNWFFWNIENDTYLTYLEFLNMKYEKTNRKN